MKKILNMKIRWHIVLIVVFILVLSLGSWLKFAKATGSSLQKHLLSNVTEEFYSTASVNILNDGDLQIKENCLMNFASTVDSAINTLESKWSVCKISFFSRIDSFVTYYTTGEIMSVQVLNGSNNWLFYKSRTDGNPIGDYEGTNQYTPEEMNTMLQKALMTQKLIENKEINFVILVVPNKENIYSEYMPETYVHCEASRTDKMIDFLASHGVNIISPKQELLENHLNMQLYYSYDTHWNQLGAYIGVRDTLAEWGIYLPELSKRTITTKDLRGHYHYCGEDDLAGMIGLLSVFDDEIEYEIEGTIPLDWEKYENEYYDNQISHFINSNANIPQKIMVVGDSFRSSMIPTLCEVFSDVYIVDRSYYSPDMIDEINPDYLIVEYVERYSEDISSIDELVK